MSKPAKLLKVKNLSGLGGEREVSFGAAPPERRQKGDYGKKPMETVNPDSFDDYKDRQDRWDKLYGKLP